MVNPDLGPAIFGNGVPTLMLEPAQRFSPRRSTADEPKDPLLLVAEPYFQAALDASLEAIILLESVWKEGELVDFRLIYLNPSAEVMTGITRSQGLGRTLCELFPRLRDSELIEECVQVVHTRQPMEIESAPFLSPSGLLQHQIVPLRDGVAITMRDVTKQKRAQEVADQIKASLKEKEVLLKEVHHRVKNNLQVISSLLNLQARHVVDRQALEMFKESQNRVRTIALFHERLYQSKDLAHVEAAEYLRNLISTLLATYGARPNAVDLKVIPSSILFGVDVAIPLGLVLNELISNALKHAFPDGKRGEVHVQLRQEGQNTYVLEVADNGIGFPTELDFRRAPSLGLQLVCTLTEQLGGSIELNNQQGTKFKVAFDAVS